MKFIKSKVKRVKEAKWMMEKAMFSTVLGGIVFQVLYPSVCYAADEGVSSVINPIKKLGGLMTAIIAAYGVVIAAKNGMEFAQAYQDRDSGSMHSASKGIIAGAMMIAIGSVLTYLGLSK